MINNILATAAYVTVSFTGLSNDKQVASEQKAVIAEALRAVFSEPSAFIEETTGLNLSIEKDQEHSRARIHCERCQLTLEASSIDHSTIRFQSQSKGERDFRISFELESASTTDETWRGGFRQTWELRGTISPLLFAIRAAAPLRSGETLAQGRTEILPCIAEVRCGEKNSFLTYREAEETAQNLLGLTAKRSIPVSHNITLSDFKRTLAVKRGRPVRVTYKSQSGLRIESKGVALESGSVGDTIMVRLESVSGRANLQSQKKLSAVVTSTGQVTYER